MKVLLVSANTEQINMQVLALGLACVATATEKAGHGVKTLDLQTCQKTCQEAIGKEVTDFNLMSLVSGV